MKRIYAIQQNNDYIETDYYFDFEEESKFLKLAIIGGRNFKSFTFEEYNRAESNFDDFLYQYELLLNKDYYSRYSNLSELVNDIFRKSNGKKYSAKEIHAFRLLYQRIENEKKYDFDDYACEFLKLITGNKYKKTAIRGDSQGDYAEVIYPETIDKETIDYIEACYFGTGTEYCIYEEETEELLTVDELENSACDNYFDYTALWNAELYKQELAKRYNLPLENIIVYEITNTKRRTIIENEYAIV